MPEAVRVRPGTATDLRTIAAIEKSASRHPWSLSQFVENSLREENGSLVLTDGDGPALGFALYQRVADEATLLNIAVQPEAQGCGHGGRLLQALQDRLAAQGTRRLLLEVRCGNTRAITLYRRFGFVEDGVRKDYYPVDGGREDALLMSRELAVLETVE